MAFKKAPDISAVPDSPEKLLLDLPRRKIPNVLPHQGEIMRSYAEKALHERDVALQLPTGSGKTLVGLLIGEWRRRKYQERVVYLCPTKQLVHQVCEQAEEKYGLSVVQFTGAIKTYDKTAKSDYKTNNKIAITTYSSLFNTNPYFNDADVVVVRIRATA
jgi:replicative superfamily II helicase